MKKITEGEIQSLVRKYLLKNNFRLVTRTLDGESLHYQVKLTNPPEFKMPDLVAIKSNTALVFEEKITYSSLFKKNNEDSMSDIGKLLSFLNNKQALAEFQKLLARTGLPLTSPTVVGACASLKPARRIRKIPSDFLFIAIKVSTGGFSVELSQARKLRNLFEVNRCKFVL